MGLVLLKKKFRKILPEPLVISYHYVIAWSATFLYGFPSKKLIIVGVTGTKGKTTTVNYISRILEESGKNVASITSANIRINRKETLNATHMSMPGRGKLQAFLSKALKEGCTYAIIEVTSEGMKLMRHKGIIFDIAVFTNLSPEHLPSHGGSFEKYKSAKAKLFLSLRKKKKQIAHLPPTTIIVNADSEHAAYYNAFKADVHISYGITDGDIRASILHSDIEGTEFEAENTTYHTALPGEFVVYNALAAIAVGNVLQLTKSDIQKGINELTYIPGRMEIVRKEPFTVIVDYAHEKLSMESILKTGRLLAKTRNVLVLFGAQGGGRDTGKRKAMGELAGKYADIVVLTADDSYNEKTEDIIEEIATEVRIYKKENENLFLIPERKEAINKILSLAKEDDVVVLAGKGAEQQIYLNGKSIPWDDREIVRQYFIKAA